VGEGRELGERGRGAFVDGVDGVDWVDVVDGG